MCLNARLNHTSYELVGNIRKSYSLAVCCRGTQNIIVAPFYYQHERVFNSAFLAHISNENISSCDLQNSSLQAISKNRFGLDDVAITIDERRNSRIDFGIPEKETISTASCSGSARTSGKAVRVFCSSFRPRWTPTER